jgi:hypothetical protein
MTTKKTPKYVKVAALVREGYSRKAIGHMMGIKIENVGSYITNARNHNISLKPDAAAGLVGQMPPKVSEWLRKQVPEGATMGDVIVAILTDAFQDETGENSH